MFVAKHVLYLFASFNDLYATKQVVTNMTKSITYHCAYIVYNLLSELTFKSKKKKNAKIRH